MRTLGPLVSGATSGLLTEVIVADGGSRDGTAEVAEFAGCRFMAPAGTLGERLRTAAQTARTPWLLFLRPGAALDPAWVDAVRAFLADAGTGEAATFRSKSGESRSTLRAIVTLLAARFGRPSPDHGLLIARSRYDMLGGHDASPDAERALLRRLGRLPWLPATIEIHDT